MHLPEFSGAGKNAITIRHVWTHTCALLNVEQRLFPVRYNQSHAANVALICAAEIDPGVKPGAQAGYQTTSLPLVGRDRQQETRARLSGRCSRRGVFAAWHEGFVAWDAG
jgi:hypothetical protein